MKHVKPKRKMYIPFGPVNGVERISCHCLVRFSERVTAEYETVGRVIVRLEKMLSNSIAVYPKPDIAARKLMAHDMRQAIYYANLNGRPVRAGLDKNSWILVVVGDCLKTIYQNCADEYEIR